MALPFNYHWRSLFVRKATTLLTLLVIAAVVGVLTWMVGFQEALRRSLSMAQDGHKLVVLRGSATSESNSALSPKNVHDLTQLFNLLEKDPNTGQPLISPEMMVQVQLPRVGDDGTTLANIAIRGVTEPAFKVHRNVKPLGRTIQPGSRQLIVGLAAAKQFKGLDIGTKINLGYGKDRAYEVVGYFSADGGPMESEIWGYLPSLMDSYSRTLYSSANVRVSPEIDSKQVIDQITGPAIQLTAYTEADYWQEQSKNIRIYLYIVSGLVVIMCLAAVFSIANTMFSLVSGRTREIGMLRTIGFSGFRICTGFVLEALLLSLMGGVLGCLGCYAWLSLMGNTKDMFGASTFTTLAFEIRMTGAMVAIALLAISLVGIVGAIFPAVRAMRVNAVASLRDT